MVPRERVRRWRWLWRWLVSVTLGPGWVGLCRPARPASCEPACELERGLAVVSGGYWRGGGATGYGVGCCMAAWLHWLMAHLACGWPLAQAQAQAGGRGRTGAPTPTSQCPRTVACCLLPACCLIQRQTSDVRRSGHKKGTQRPEESGSEQAPCCSATPAPLLITRAHQA